MKKLAKREEQIMQVYWDLGKAFIKEVIPHLPDPKPHYNSVATIVKILEEKGFLDHEAVGMYIVTFRRSQERNIKSMI